MKVVPKKYLRLIILLLSAGILYQILIFPYIGMANNGDQQRISKKAGIDYSYDAWETDNREDTFFNYIVNDYTYITPIKTGFSSSYEIIVWFSKGIKSLLSKTGQYDIRYMGISAFVFYIMSISLLCVLLYKYFSNKTIYFWGFVVLVFSIDAYIVQYMNSFYSEIGSIVYLLMFFICSFVFVFNKRKRVQPFVFIMQVIFALLFTACKKQDMLTIFPIMLLLIMEAYSIVKNINCIMKIKYKIIVSISTILIIVAIPWLLINLTNDTSVGNTRIYNVVMKTMLTYSKNPEKHLRKMGIESDGISLLANHVGEDAYESAELYEKYGKYYTTMQEIKILLREPSILKMFIDRAHGLFITSENYRLGNFTKSAGLLPQTKSQAFRLWSTVKDHIYFHNAGFYAAILFAGMLVCFVKIKNWINIDMYHLYFLLIVINIIQYITIILGDRSNDDLKHFFLLNIEFDIIFIALLWCIAKILYQKITSISRLSENLEENII